MPFVPPPWQRIIGPDYSLNSEYSVSILGMPCAYCGRADQPDRTGRCNGCGSPHPPSERIDVTRFADRERVYVWIPR